MNPNWTIERTNPYSGPTSISVADGARVVHPSFVKELRSMSGLTSENNKSEVKGPHYPEDVGEPVTALSEYLLEKTATGLKDFLEHIFTVYHFYGDEDEERRLKWKIQEIGGGVDLTYIQGLLSLVKALRASGDLGTTGCLEHFLSQEMAIPRYLLEPIVLKFIKRVPPEWPDCLLSPERRLERREQRDVTSRILWDPNGKPMRRAVDCGPPVWRNGGMGE